MSLVQYTHISMEERIIIENRLRNAESLCKIASAIGRSPSTLSREIGRNCTPSQNITTRVNRSPFQNIDSRHFRGQAFVLTVRDSKKRYYERLNQFKARQAHYGAKQAQVSASLRQAEAQRVIPTLDQPSYTKTKQYIHDQLRLRWSPEQIRLRLEVVGLP
jgi:IS30 family transposase